MTNVSTWRNGPECSACGKRTLLISEAQVAELLGLIGAIKLSHRAQQLSGSGRAPIGERGANRDSQCNQSRFRDRAVEATCCARQGKRLCTSAEWQRACRGPDNLTYPYGHSYKPGKCVSERSEKGSPDRSRTHPECRSGWGVYDMSGNLSEWVEDYHDRARGTRVSAGGSFAGGRFETKCAAREGRAPRSQSRQVGFRCCASLRRHEQ